MITFSKALQRLSLFFSFSSSSFPPVSLYNSDDVDDRDGVIGDFSFSLFFFFLLARTTPICIISKFSLDLAPARLDDDDDDNFHHKVFTHYFSLFALLFSTTTTTRFPMYVSHYPLPISSISSTLCIFPLFTHLLFFFFFPFARFSPLVLSPLVSTTGTLYILYYGWIAVHHSVCKVE